VIFSMMFRVPVPNPSPDLTDKVKATLLSQVSEIANQVCDSMLVTGAAVPLKNRDGLGGPGNVIGFIGHAIFLDSAVKRGETLTIRNLAFGTRSKSHLCTIVVRWPGTVRGAAPLAYGEPHYLLSFTSLQFSYGE